MIIPLQDRRCPKCAAQLLVTKIKGNQRQQVACVNDKCNWKFNVDNTIIKKIAIHMWKEKQDAINTRG